MAVRKDTQKNKWCADFYLNGKRVRRFFATKGEAVNFERINLNISIDERAAEAITPAVSPKQSQPLSYFAKEWFSLYGQTLADGEARLQKILNTCYNLGDPLASEFSAEMFADYRRLRLAGKFSANAQKPPKEATVNREHAYLRALFNELKKLGKWQGENPLNGIRLFRERAGELAFLYEHEIQRLLWACDESRNPDLGFIVRVCLATGARWSEAEMLTGSQVIPYKITFVHTKSNRNRTVPISKELYDLLPKKRGRLFCDAYEAFEGALNRAEIELPKGQLTHVLRHTFASHFMMNGGNILVLKDILGHSTVEMTMRYAHFSPTHLESAVTLNPLSNILK